ncbi:MAG: YbaB/EbfC family nucleoid-associated protein [Planctomycetia bacterium]|nr:YbaB/EbfC family nucleoid-associated protein [Planctomycetia bacterium]
MFGNPMQLLSMLGNMGKIRERVTESVEKLRGQRLTGSAGGGLVEVDVNGMGEVQACRIDPSLMGGDREMLEDLVVSAMTDSVRRSREAQKELMMDAAKEMGIPGAAEIMGGL